MKTPHHFHAFKTKQWMECSQPDFSERKICSSPFTVVAQRLWPYAPWERRKKPGVRGPAEGQDLTKADSGEAATGVRQTGNQDRQDYPMLNIREKV